MKNHKIYSESFADRHIGPSADEIQKMLNHLELTSLDKLIEETIPSNIKTKKQLDIPNAKTETEFLMHANQLAEKNKVFKSYIGIGYYNCFTPQVIQRNILENPGWYTAYTPYQAEIAQGRLEALLLFQTMVIDMTGLQIANASLLDEATASAEAMLMFHNLRKGDKKNANKFFISENCHLQTIDVIKGRAIPRQIDVVIEDPFTFIPDEQFFGAIIQYPDTNGLIFNPKIFIEKCHSNEILVCLATDMLSLALLTPPGELGADAAVGTTQRFGISMGMGGPHAAFFAAKDEFKRAVPGRIIGISVDSHGNKAYRMSLQTREQHIKRERATSNICTSQVLLAVMSAMFAVYHGPERIKKIASRVHGLTKMLDKKIKNLGYKQINENYFDTLKINSGDKSNSIKELALKSSINFRYFNDDMIGISLDETTTEADVYNIIHLFAKAAGKTNGAIKNDTGEFNFQTEWIPELIRKSGFLTHYSFNNYHSETDMLRFLKNLENKDLSLTHSMISLGSCTMKLNATSEMVPVTMKGFAEIHPFVPDDQVEGYMEMVNQLGKWLCNITGFDAISFQPNSGAQGEFAGLMVIREYFNNKNEKNRNIALIPSSAHGTNPASAVMAGMNVVIVKCDEKGNIDLQDLKTKAESYSKNLACLMVTYPSTHGVFEESITTVCEIIHQCGGQVYMDGANLNAQLGLTNPTACGADVCHLNLHKTFCIPHGGGGPGMGPIGVKSHLAPFLPSHPVNDRKEKGCHAISATKWGSPGILPISYGYISMMGGEGLTLATKIAILNANYIKCRLEKKYSILFQGTHKRVAHEMIVDCRSFKQSAGVEVEDIAKRLIDYGFHAPTVSFPVPGTLMIEPTESESLKELDRFCEAMLHIRMEIKEIEDGKASRTDNVLKNAPHTIGSVCGDEWKHEYSREKAAMPVKWLKENKFWSYVGRINNAYGDRNLLCSCNPVEFYAEPAES